MASLRRLAWNAVKVVGGSLLDAALQKVVTIKRRWFVLRLQNPLTPQALYSVYSESLSFRDSLRKVSTLILGFAEDWQIGLQDATGQWWYLTYPGKVAPS